MKIQKVNFGNFDANFIKNNRFSTLHISMIFETEFTRKNLFLIEMLMEYLANTNSVYKTKKEINTKIRELYSMSLGGYCFSKGNELITEYNIIIFDPKLVGEDYFNEAIDFAKTCFYKPNFKNGTLDKGIFNKIKLEFKNHFLERLTNPKSKLYNDFLNSVFPDTIITREVFKNKKDLLDFVKNIKQQDIIDIYNKLINESFVGMNLFGNFDDKQFESIKKAFTFKTVKQLKTDYIVDAKINDKKKNITVLDKELNESRLYDVYKINNLNYKKDKFAFNAIMMMLNYDSGRLIHKVLRDELNIVYNAGASTYLKEGVMIFYASIDGKNKDVCLKGIKQIFHKLKDTTVLKKLLDDVKKTVNDRYYVYYENKYDYIDEMMKVKYLDSITYETYIKKMMALSIDDILKALDKLEHKVTYLHRGVKNEK